jgi:hypothetical protein
MSARRLSIESTITFKSATLLVLVLEPPSPRAVALEAEALGAAFATELVLAFGAAAAASAPSTFAFASPSVPRPRHPKAAVAITASPTTVEESCRIRASSYLASLHEEERAATLAFRSKFACCLPPHAAET